MKGFFSLREIAPGQWIWILHAGNFREILRSQRSYNRDHHARDAARRLHKIIVGASFKYGKGFGPVKRASR